MSRGELTTAPDPVIEQNRRMLLLAVAILALTIPAAYYSGVVLLRWGDPVDMPRHLAVLEQIPDLLGEWRFVAEGKAVSDEVIQKLELRGHLHRIYEHPATGQRVALLLLVGPAGPLVRHPPEICYETSANSLLNSRLLSINVNDHQDHLRLLSYQSDSLIDGDFLVAYGFGADQRWDCPESPRMAYGGKPALFKLQVLTETANESSVTRPEGLMDFLFRLLPVLDVAMTDDSSR